MATVGEAIGDQAASVCPGGYREVLRISLPLILSTSSISLMHLVDRIFLSWYSPEALAASLPAGAASWVFISVCIGTTGYVSTFVSQYDGAGRQDRIGVAVWQGIYFSFLAAFFLVGVSFLSEPIFRLAGHTPAVMAEEIVFFRVLTLGGGGGVLAAALSSFYSGRGKTWVVMWVNLGGALLNGILDYFLIFGHAGFPRWGIFGAGVASTIAPWTMALAYLVLILLPANRREFQTLQSWPLDRDLFSRLIRFGLPSGFQFMADVLSFTVFVLLIGRIGEAELAASNVAFSLNTLLFMPMVGLSMGTAVLVGRYLGADQPDISAKATLSAYWMAVAYMGSFSIVIGLWPDLFISAFHPRDSGVDFTEVARLGHQLLYFVAGYSIIDASNIIFIAALKGAGDTRYVLWMMVVMATFLLVIPSYVACIIFGAGIYTAWAILTLYVIALAIGYGLRFRGGKWRSMRVIEHTVAPGATLAEGPIVES